VYSDLRWVHDPAAAVAYSDGETQCSKVRSDAVRDGSSLRSQAAVGPCGFTHRRSRADHSPPISLSGVRVRRVKEINGPSAPSFLVCTFASTRTDQANPLFFVPVMLVHGAGV
jgi:hypothetical protein